MSTPVIAFFNNKGGVGKTSLVYHLAWMYAEMGVSVLAADLDPQANLTIAFLDEDQLEKLWAVNETAPENVVPGGTIYGCIEPLLRGVGDILEHPHIEPLGTPNGAPNGAQIGSRLHLLVGDLALARFEDELAQQWPLCLDGKERAFRVISAFWRLLQRGAESGQADVVLVDLGPNLGAINRAVLVAADYLVVPMAPDLFSLQGLKNLGPTVRDWRREWQERRARAPQSNLVLPLGTIDPLGYIVMQHAVRLDRPVKAYDRWMVRIPEVFSTEVLGEPPMQLARSIDNDPHCIGLVKHYHSLMPMAREARKPMFKLTPADGAIGAHTQGVREAYDNLHGLAQAIKQRYQSRWRQGQSV